MPMVFNSLSGTMSCPWLIRLYRNNKIDIRKHINSMSLFFFPLTAANLFAFYPDFFFVVCLFLPGPPLHFCGVKQMHLLAWVYRGRPSAGCLQRTVPITTGTTGLGGLIAILPAKRNRAPLPLLDLQALPLSRATLLTNPTSPASTQPSNSF